MKKLIEIITKLLPLKCKIENISSVKMDSRLVSKDDLFFAINNGNKYIESVLEKGASLVISDDKKWENHERVVVVENTVETMQNLAREYRKTLPVKIIGVVGSNGKTTTKDIIHSIISSKYRCKKTEGNYNNHIGVPYTIFQLDENDEYAVLEMGMSSRGEIKFLCDIADVDYGVITNIGDSHLEFLINRDNVFLEKSEIKNYVPKDRLILFGDDVYLKNLEGIKVGFEKNNNFIIKNYREDETGVFFEIDNEYHFSMNGKHNCVNAAMGVTVGKTLGLSYEDIQNGLVKCNVTPMRFQKIEKNGIKYINDSYNASPVSMKYSLDTLAEVYKGIHKIAVLADMGELGEDELSYHEDVLKHAFSLDIDKIIILGPLMEKASEKIMDKERLIIAKNKTEIKDIIKKDFSNYIILLKGSNFNHLWEIME